MHKDFGEWYRLAGMEPDGTILASRWAVIEKNTPDADGVVGLTQVFYGLGKPKESIVDAFVQSFHESDGAFRTRNNANELLVLAGAQLVETIDKAEMPLSDFAALALVSAAANTARPAPAVKDMPEIAARHLEARSRDRLAGLDESQDAAGRKELLAGLTALGAPYDSLAQELRQWQRQLEVTTEESNILWWLFSEFSRDERQRWSNFPVPSAAIMAGKELADLTVVLPGPVAAFAFLDRVVRCTKAKPPSSVSIEDAINELSAEWRDRYIKKNVLTELEPLLPVGYGIKMSRTSDDKNAWVSAFSQKTGIPAVAKVAPNLLAYQVFIEALLACAWKGLK